MASCSALTTGVPTDGDGRPLAPVAAPPETLVIELHDARSPTGEAAAGAHALRPRPARTRCAHCRTDQTMGGGVLPDWCGRGRRCHRRGRRARATPAAAQAGS
jgi:hypothetical protein